MTGHCLNTELAPGSPEWLSKITATQVVTIAGLTPPEWDTPYALWVAKREAMRGSPIPRPVQTDAQTRGHELEPLIVGHLRDRYPDWKFLSTGTWQHDVRDWQVASPDGLVVTDDETMCLEVKSVHPGGVIEWANGVPARVQAQVQWQMDVTGHRRTLVAMSSGFEIFDRRPRVEFIDYDSRAAALLRESAIRFIQSIELGIEPDPNYATSPDREALRWLHPTIVDSPGVDIPDEIAVPYLEALAAEKRATADKAQRSAELAAFLGDGRKATWNGTTLGSRKNGRGDNPPSFSASPGLADKATNLLNPKASTAA